jgi:uncharacterized protein (UPF0548 family)
MRIKKSDPLTFLMKPSEATLQAFVEEQKNLDFSYKEVGATKSVLPSGYDHDKSSCVLGKGEAVFLTAEKILRNWKMWPEEWAKIYPKNIEQESGNLVVCIFRVYGFWWVNALKIVYKIEEKNTSFKRRSGFAYGTLKAHAVMGEEIFAVTWHNDDTVTYDMLAFSKPNFLFGRIFKPLARQLQKRFVRCAQKKITEQLTQIN